MLRVMPLPSFLLQDSSNSCQQTTFLARADYVIHDAAALGRKACFLNVIGH